MLRKLLSKRDYKKLSPAGKKAVKKVAKKTPKKKSRKKRSSWF